MDLVVEPEYYTPSIDDDGSYIDKIPSFHLLQNGIRCLCGSRKEKIFNQYSSFAAHIKTGCHRNWLISINQNRLNFYKENEEMKTIITNQRLIIAQLEKEVTCKNNTIEQLTQHNCTLKEKYDKEIVRYTIVQEMNLLDM